jgi:hypothetical protein
MPPVTLPSGLAGEVRGLTGREGKLLTSADAAKSGRVFDEILAGCWVSTTNPGPYRLGADGRPDWQKVLVGDRMAALLKVRAATFGPTFAFGVQCEAAVCRHRFEWELNLETYPIKPLPERSIEAFRNGSHLSAKFPRDGRAVTFKLLTGADAQRLAGFMKAAKHDDKLITSLLGRIVEIAGVEGNDRRKVLEAMPFGDLTELLNEIDEQDGGIESDLWVECPACGTSQEIKIPFSGREFWIPSKRKNTTPADP